MGAIVWPDGRRFVQLYCRLGVARPDDTTDADAFPDLKSQPGTVTITASIPFFRIIESDGIARAVMLLKEQYIIGEDGKLKDHNGEGVYAVDPMTTDPSGWKYMAEIIPEQGGNKIVVEFGGETQLPDVVDLINFASVASEPATSNFEQRLATLEANIGGDITQLDVQWAGTQVAINGKVSPDLRGPQGFTGPPPTVSWNGDKLVVDGVTGPSLTGQTGATGAPGTPGAKGDTGAPGALANMSSYLIVGPGRPDTPSTTSGIITGSEPNGALYRSTDGNGVGAWEWTKRNNSWIITNADTGWRQIPITDVDPDLTGNFYLRFTHLTCALSLQDIGATFSGARQKLFTLNNRFRPVKVVFKQSYRVSTVYTNFSIGISGSNASVTEFFFYMTGPFSGQSIETTWTTRNSKPWPTTIPGTAVNL